MMGCLVFIFYQKHFLWWNGLKAILFPLDHMTFRTGYQRHNPPTFICSKSITETLERCVNFCTINIDTARTTSMTTFWWLLVTLSKFNTSFWCCYYWLWTSKGRHGSRIWYLLIVKSWRILLYFSLVKLFSGTEFKGLANQLTGFYMRATLAFNRLIILIIA